MIGGKLQTAGLILCLALQTARSQAPQVNRVPQLISFNKVDNGLEGYSYSFEIDDGTKRFEEGKPVNGVWTINGYVSWYSPDGKQHSFEYKADDRGTVYTPKS